MEKRAKNEKMKKKRGGGPSKIRKKWKKVQFTKLCLTVKPPLVKRPFRHMMKFLKIGIFGGGLTLVPRCKRQEGFHQGISAKQG